MSRTKLLSFVLLASIVLSCLPSVAGADIVCPDSSYATVSFSRTFTGSYRTGEPFDVVTISPFGDGETFASAGITIRVYLKNCQGAPLVGVPRQEIVLYNSNLCICPGGNIADAATDINGSAQFSGTLQAGGCANLIGVFADGVLISNLQVKLNSPDEVPASPCFVDASDLAALVQKRATQVGQPNYSICFDYNEDGFVDASDIARFAIHLGGSCP